jgi:alpha-ribazole phosphatase/probable phosphoglycerate mutase
MDDGSGAQMTEILLIRHPETDLAGTFCGHSDPPINAAGQAQVEVLLKSLESEPLEAVYASDLRRAETLAHAVAAAHRIPCIVRPALREIHFGEWESLTWAEIEQRQPEQAAAWLANYPHRCAPKGESFGDFQARVLAEVDCILAEPQERIAIVTHGGVMRTILTMRGNVDEQTAWTLTKLYCSVIRYAPNVTTVPQ